ncbi:MAG: hypothetical protein K2X44_12730, partial [Magnetospirillum sp.]|nr:hypothetical protein [Magnetospirillum sp.]
IAALGIAGLAGTMLVFKYPHLTGMLVGVHDTLLNLSAIEWIGLSYTTFRAMDLLLHVRSSRTASFRPVDGLAYLTFFPPFIAGPINRFAPFVKDQDGGQKPLPHAELRGLILRFSVGVIKIVLLSRLAWYWSIPGLPADLDGVSRGQAVLGMYAYFVYVYFEFSGYTDIVIVLARLFGVTVPENFRSPLLAANIQDFWNRWQISLSQWCRDHIFYALVRRLAQGNPRLPTLAASMISILATFLFIGSWHGDSLNWVLYGLYHGIGLAGWMLWRQWLKRVPAFADYLDTSAMWRVASTALTFNFVTWGLLLSLNSAHMHRVIHTIFG